jgi:hypothetical protein
MEGRLIANLSRVIEVPNLQNIIVKAMDAIN